MVVARRVDGVEGRRCLGERAEVGDAHRSAGQQRRQNDRDVVAHVGTGRVGGDHLGHPKAGTVSEPDRLDFSAWRVGFRLEEPRPCVSPEDERGLVREVESVDGSGRRTVERRRLHDSDTDLRLDPAADVVGNPRRPEFRRERRRVPMIGMRVGHGVPAIANRDPASYVSWSSR